MCGRLAFFEPEALKTRYGVEEIPLVKPSFNFGPGMNGPVITKQSPVKVSLMKWGLIPFWAKDDKIGFKTFNARVETAKTKPAFRRAFMHGRCLIPMNGFYEWQETETGKQPYYFYLKDKSIMSAAGLYENNSFSILTTEADETMKSIHDRMPIVLDRKKEAEWLEKAKLSQALLSKHPVSKAVGSIKNDSKDLIEPTQTYQTDKLF